MPKYSAMELSLNLIIQKNTISVEQNEDTIEVADSSKGLENSPKIF
jgi:hypothetical protein